MKSNYCLKKAGVSEILPDPLFSEKQLNLRLVYVPLKLPILKKKLPIFFFLMVLLGFNRAPPQQKRII